MKLRIAILFSLLTATSFASAQIYKCSDPNTGRINFTDVPCQRLGSSQITGGNTAQSAETDLSTDEMSKRIRDAENAIHKAMVENATKKAMHTASKDEDPRFQKMVLDNSWRFKANKECTEEQNVKRREDFNKDRLIYCIYRKVEIHINQLAELSGDQEISQILTSSIYPDIKRKPETPTHSSETVLLKKGKAGISQALTLGLLSVATQADLRKWQDKSGATTLPAILTHMEKYNIKGKIDLAGGLTGADAVVFLVPNALTVPSGDRGHSIVLIQDNGSCLGYLCNEIK